MWSGVIARPKISLRGVQRIEGRMWSLSWQMASLKCLGQEYGMELGSMRVSESTNLSMLGEHRW